MQTHVFAVDITADGSPVEQLTLPFPVEFSTFGTEITWDKRLLRVFSEETEALRFAHKLAQSEIKRLRQWLKFADVELAGV